MAVWSEINSRDMPGFRLDPEYYQPRYLELAERLAAVSPVAIDDFAYVTDGIHGSPEWVEEGGITYLSAKCVRAGYFVLTDAGQISQEQNRLNPRTQARVGDVLLTTVGTIGNVAVVSEDILPANMDRHLGIIRINEDSFIDPYYLAIFLNSELGRFQTLREATGNVQLNLFIDKIKKLLVPANSRLNKLGDLARKSYEKRREAEALYARAENLLVQELGINSVDLSHQLTYEQNFSETQEARRYDAEYFQPKYTEILNRINQLGSMKLHDWAHVKSGYPWKSEYFIEAEEAEEAEEAGEPFVRIRDCKPGAIDVEELSKLTTDYANKEGVEKAKPKDLVIGMDGVKYFYCSMIISDCYVNQRVCQASAKADSSIPPEYILLVINSPIGQLQLLREMTIAHTVGHITNENIRNLLIPILPDVKIKQLSKLVAQSIQNKFEAKRLINKAKQQIEEMILGEM